MINQKNNLHYKIIAKAIHYLASKRELQPSLTDLSAYIGLSASHLQRIFVEWAGISPKQFLHYLTKEYAKEKLKNNSVLDAAFCAGLSSASRLHDLMIHYEAITPGEYKNSGKGLILNYYSFTTLFGECFIAVSPRGICKLAFFDTQTELALIEAELHQQWANAVITKNRDNVETYFHSIFAIEKHKKPLKLFLKGTPFQLKVWEALLSIPEGQLFSYEDIAKSINQQSAVRAAASAIGNNPIAYIIPCHRVIRKTGDFGQYRWNLERKKALIAWEGCSNERDV